VGVPFGSNDAPMAVLLLGQFILNMQQVFVVQIIHDFEHHKTFLVGNGVDWRWTTVYQRQWWLFGTGKPNFMYCTLDDGAVEVIRWRMGTYWACVM
jgi:hypothetical protein